MMMMMMTVRRRRMTWIIIVIKSRKQRDDIDNVWENKNLLSQPVCTKASKEVGNLHCIFRQITFI